MRKYIILFVLMLTVSGINAQAPKWLKKARNAQVSIVAYAADGKMQEAQGVLIDEQGTVVTEYDFLKGAVRATAIDNTGKEYPVTEIAGASAMYNVAKIKLELGKAKIAALHLTSTTMAKESRVFILPNVKADKKALCTIDTITDVQTFRDKYSYYSLKNTVSERLATAAVMTEEGEMVAMVQLAAKEGNSAFAIDSHFAAELKVTALDAGNNDLKAISIKKSLPESEEDASTFIFLTGQKDTILYKVYVDDFITRYPQNANGYLMKAEQQIASGEYSNAKDTYDKALSITGIKKDEIYYSMSKMIYSLNTKSSYQQFEDWNLERALKEASNAYEANPLPLYTQQEANILFALKQYDAAAEKFLALTKTNLRSADLFMYAAQCKEEAKAGEEEILALMDSALACYPKPLPVTAASTVIIRARALAKAGKNREAVMGYNDFEHLNGGNVTANFYYEKEQLEVKCRMYPAALSDIEKAIQLSPKEAILYAEGASLNYRVGEVDDAIHYAEKAIEVDKNFTDAYRILGVCLIQKGNKAEARKNLQKAIELGDGMAQGILDKMQ